ncbi:hypothetical protein [Singulisphaera sp. PoT]|uniref:hypothetical protein n=1 Tax=Singulisphaera sp. PoT TaxID=3411797 RepID=UPI003BF4DD05
MVALVERFLGEELSLGITASTNWIESIQLASGESSEDEDDPDAWNIYRRSYLDYGRIGGKYRIYVTEQTVRDIDPNSNTDARKLLAVEETPWSSCSREMKLKAFTKLPELLERIVDQALELTAKAAKTADTVRDILDAMMPEAAAVKAGASPVRASRNAKPAE